MKPYANANSTLSQEFKCPKECTWSENNLQMEDGKCYQQDESYFLKSPDQQFPSHSTFVWHARVEREQKTTDRDKMNATWDFN